MSNTDGLPMFEKIPPPLAKNEDPDTSHQAAASMKDEAKAQRRLILRELELTGPMTADALDDALDLRPTSAGRRMGELKRAGLVVMLEKKGLTRSGRKARLWALPKQDEPCQR